MADRKFCTFLPATQLSLDAFSEEGRKAVDGETGAVWKEGIHEIPGTLHLILAAHSRAEAPGHHTLFKDAGRNDTRVKLIFNSATI